LFMIPVGNEELRKWFLSGVEKNHKYMLIIYSFIHTSYFPVYADNAAEARDHLYYYEYEFFGEAMKIYDLTMDMEEQLAEYCAWHLLDLPLRVD